jgi:hypothetical protein
MMRPFHRITAVSRHFLPAAVRRRFRRRRVLSCGSLECTEPLEKRLLLSATRPIDFQPIQIAESLTNDAGTVLTIDPTPTVEWNETDATVTYEIWGNEVGVEARQFFAFELTEPQFTPQTPLHDGLYRIFIRAEFADGAHSDWSSPFDLVVRSSSFTPSVDSFAQSLTWIPQPKIEQWSVTELQPVVQNVVRPAASSEIVAVLPTTDDTEWLTTSSTLYFSSQAIQNESTTKREPKLDLAEADPNALEGPDSLQSGDQTDENDPRRDRDDNPAEQDTPNINRPHPERIAEEPNRNGMTRVDEAAGPRTTLVGRILDAESREIDRVFAELALHGLLMVL